MKQLHVFKITFSIETSKSREEIISEIEDDFMQGRGFVDPTMSLHEVDIARMLDLPPSIVSIDEFV